MFTENLGRVAYAPDVDEAEDTRCDRARGIVMLVQFGVGNGSCIHDRLVISKHNGRRLNWHTEVSKGITDVDELFRTRRGWD